MTDALSMRVVLADPDPTWPAQFAREAERLRSALGERALAVEHVGSTAVPGLAAKPVIDVLLVVDDAGDASYADLLTAVGYVLHRDLGESRFFKRGDGVHLHVFTIGSPHAARMIRFRDHLRRDSSDRALYLETKQRLAARDWPRARDYAEAKSAVVEAILERA